jgi:O-antigen/teichoic acid export membrane protein
VHIAFSSAFLWCVPFLSLLEGCDQVAPVAQFRLVQTFVSNCVFLVAIWAGANLWAAPAMSSMSALFCFWYLVVTRRQFFRPFFRPPEMEGMNWRVEIWPMQWRLASQAVLAYFFFSLFTPVIFHYRGPVEAGQMGMSFQLVMAVQAMASIWILTKVPRFGILVARKEFDSLDAEWRRAGWLSVYVMVAGVVLLLGALYAVNIVRPGIANRVLPPVAFAMLAIGALFGLASQSYAVYLRAHKREVLMAATFASAGSMGVLVWQCGMRFGSIGVSAAYLFVMSIISFPTVFLIWRKARKEWHSHDVP